MDLTLNVTSTPGMRRKIVKETSIKNGKITGNDFSFKFTNNNKVKAILARKRPNKSAKKINETQGNTTNTIDTNFNNNKFVLKQNLEQNNKKPIKSVIIDNSNDILNVKKNDVKPPVNTKKFEAKKTNNLLLNVRESSSQISLNVSNNSTDFVKNIFDPERQRRIDSLKNRINISDHNSTGEKKPLNRPNKPHRRGEQTNNSKNTYALFGKNPEIPLMGQRLVKPIFEKVFTGVPMSELGLHPHAVKNIKDLLNIDELTTVQQRAIPIILKNTDVLVRSQTGSGKTLAYALPIVQKLQEIRPKISRDCGVQALIVVPTRELAMQSYELFIKLLKPFSWIVPGYLSGGEKRKSEKARLRKGINILVGTPGRLCDHLLQTESFKLDKVKYLVLDEADRLFELGYEKDVSRIVNALNGTLVTNAQERNARNELLINKQRKLNEDESDKDDNQISNIQISSSKLSNKEILAEPKILQTIMLSATLTSSVEELAGLTLKNPLFIDTADENITSNKVISLNDAFNDAITNEQLIIPSTIFLSYTIVPPKLRLVVLSGLIAQECNKKLNKILVFMETQESIDFHHDLMVETLTRRILDEDDEDEDDVIEEDGLLKGVRFFKLHGSMNQQDRIGVFNSFRSAKAGVLLTTDVAARGLDVPEVDLVIQYSPPQRLSDFVHRVGRTARAGKSGRATIIISPNETEYIRILEDKRIRISQFDMKSALDAIMNSTEIKQNNQEAASSLQYKFENLITEDQEMYEKACKAYVSWVRFYSAFPKELKHIFNVRNTHMGHFAKSFGLKEPPKSFAKYHTILKDTQPKNRLTYKNRDEEKTGIKRNRPFSSNIPNKNPRTVCLTTSEFDSGLKPLKKKKK